MPMPASASETFQSFLYISKNRRALFLMKIMRPSPGSVGCESLSNPEQHAVQFGIHAPQSPNHPITRKHTSSLTERGAS